ncbi:site-specific integrase [Salinivibrio sp. SS3]|uniref:site-specific integrase n=1 Tax=Salinivibrio sp. SS3 TaxID=1895021 RepID=UPI0009F28FFB|nr:site-specific integrase [Salinivibrio sp. BNH]
MCDTQLSYTGDDLHIYKRKNSSVYYFQKRVPSHLVEHYGKRLIRFSLKTSNKTQAKQLAAIEAGRLTEEFAKLDGHSLPERKVELVDLQNLAIEAANHWITHKKDHMFASGVSYESLHHGLDESLSSIQEHAEGMLYHEATFDSNLRVKRVFEGVLPDRAFDIYSDLEPQQKARVFIEFAKQLRAQTQGLYALISGTTPSITSVVKPIPKIEKAPTIELVAAEFLENKKTEMAASGKPMSSKLEQRYQVSFDCLIGLLGGDTPVRDVSTTDIRELRDVLISTPCNSAKLKETKALTTPELIAAVKNGQLQHLKSLSVTSINQRLEAVSAMFKFAVQERYASFNPAESVRLKKAIADKDARLPYPPEMLSRLLQLTKGTVHYWIVRVALCCGLRMNEIVQLRPSDIRQQEGIWYISVNDEGGKALKTHTSARSVPIPDVLLKLGFIEFVRSVSTETIFNIKKPKGGGYRSDIYSKKFRYFTKTHDLRADRVTFHSLRHNFKDLALNAGIPEVAYKQLGGWADGSVSGNYGSGLTIANLKKYIETIDYPIDEQEAVDTRLHMAE